MIKGPIWKDTYYNDSSDTLSYKIQTTAGTVIHQAYTKKMPGTTGVTLNINNKVDEYLKPDFDSDFSVVENEVIKNSKAFWNYGLYRDTIPESLLESYQFLYDWSYNEDWTGQTKYNMTEPINGHLDPRMKALFTIYNTGQTTFETVIDGQMLGSYLTLEIIEPGKLYISNRADGVLDAKVKVSVSLNGGEWSEPSEFIEFGGPYPSVYPALNAGDIVRLRGDNDYTASYDPGKAQFTYLNIGGVFSSTFEYAKFKAYGNVMSLIDSQNFMNMPEEVDYVSLDGLEDQERVGTHSHCLARLFRKAYGLVDAYYLCLPAQIVDTYGYCGMFDGCTSLTTAPSILPATGGSSSCYDSMFVGCTSLTTIPSVLPIEVFYYYQHSAYGAMFYNCTSLTTAPRICVKTLGYYVGSTFAHMFDGCESLTVVPDLPEVTYIKVEHQDVVNTGLYYRMFAGCTSLKRAPYLPSLVAPKRCYENMFQGCTAMTDAMSVLPATKLYSECYAGMFVGCTSLVNPPKLPTTNIRHTDYQGPNNTNHIYYPEGIYRGMFANCTSLTTAPELPIMVLGGNGSEAGEYSGSSVYRGMFAGCTSLVNPPVLPATTLIDNCYEDMFNGCTSLTTAPALPATTLKHSCYYEMFRGCTSLVNPPVLPAPILVTWCYIEMFRDCTSLVTAPDIQATAITGTLCCYGMFANCTSLVTGPSLLASDLVGGNIYNLMFSGCTVLNYVKCLATNTESTNLTCPNWLDGVSETGTFIKSASTQKNWDRGGSGIPYGWTVIDES